MLVIFRSGSYGRSEREDRVRGLGVRWRRESREVVGVGRLGGYEVVGRKWMLGFFILGDDKVWGVAVGNGR